MRDETMLDEMFKILAKFGDSLEFDGVTQCAIVIAVTKDGQGGRVVRLLPGSTLEHASQLLVELDVQAHAIRSQLLLRQEQAMMHKRVKDTTGKNLSSYVLVPGDDDSQGGVS